MEVAELKIRIVSEVNQAAANLQKFEEQVKKAGYSIETLRAKMLLKQQALIEEKDIAKIVIYNKEIEILKNQITKLENAGKTGFDVLGNAAQKSSISVSGAYTGLSKIANLLPGIGVAGLIAFATDPIIKWLKSVSSSSQAIKELEKENNEFRESLKRVEASALSTGIQLQAFVNIARDGNQPLNVRNEALEKANKILGEHGRQLTLTNINTKAAREQVELFTQALVQQALAAKFADRVADLMIKQKDSALGYAEALKEYKAAQKAVNQENESTAQAELGGGQILSLLNEKADAYQKLVGATTTYKGVTKQLGETLSTLNEVETKATTALAQLSNKPPKPVKPARPKKEDVNKAAKDDALEYVKGITEEFTNKPIRFPNARPLNTTQPVIVPPAPTQDPYSKWLDSVVLTNQKLKDQAQIVEGTLMPVFDSFVDAVIQGNQNLGDVFSSALKGIIAQLIKAAALAAILSLISGGASGAKGGFSFLTGLKGILGGKVPGFAGGGAISGAGTGTSDSILARLSHGEYVMKADTVSKFGKQFFDMLNAGKLPKFSTGGFVGSMPTTIFQGGGIIKEIPYIQETYISGDHLRTILKRADNTASRRG